ncbi:MAG: SBBP repeat-containing protein, partial [Phycisphaerales bacterium]|nr:SBBP repeat-containing protein [Phycisphaerales bacterium]
MPSLSRMLILTAVLATGGMVPNAGARIDPDWITRYASPDGRKDEASAVVTDAAGNVYVTGSSGFTNLGTWNVVTVSYAPDGTQRWIDIYDNPGGTQDLGSALTMAPDGTLIVVGRSAGNMLVIKYDPADGS